MQGSPGAANNGKKKQILYPANRAALRAYLDRHHYPRPCTFYFRPSPFEVARMSGRPRGRHRTSHVKAAGAALYMVCSAFQARRLAGSSLLFNFSINSH